MANKTLGRLESVDLREAWVSESGDFTPWLAREDNLILLGETLGMELELQSQEKPVGPFRADILCKNTIDDSWVLIENQLEKTDHAHLGQLITYAAGLEAVTIVWISPHFTDEHRAALDWLNKITEERFLFFGLEIELWRIGDSLAAPKFNIVSKPNEWSRSVQGTTEQHTLTSNGELRLRFWEAFRQHMEETKSFVKCQKPSGALWMSHSLSRSGAHLASIASFWGSESSTEFGPDSPEIRVELNLDGPWAKDWFAQLQAEREQIERDLGQALIWHDPPNAKSCRVYVKKSADISDEAQWPEQHEWLRKNLELFDKVFRPRIKALT